MDFIEKNMSTINSRGDASHVKPLRGDPTISHKREEEDDAHKAEADETARTKNYGFFNSALLTAESSAMVTVNDRYSENNLSVLVDGDVYSMENVRLFQNIMANIYRAADSNGISRPDFEVVVAKAADAVFPFNWRFTPAPKKFDVITVG